MLRCLAFLFVVSLHLFLYNGFYSEPQTGILMWVANSVRIICSSCIGLFLLITGYLKSAKPINKKYFTGLIPIVTAYVIVTVVLYFAFAFIDGNPISVKLLIKNILHFSYYGWYVEMYIGLILVSPIINLAIEKIEKPRYLLAMAVVMVFLSALHTLTPYPILTNYWATLYPFTFYIIGAVIKKLQPKVSPLLGFAAVAAAMLFSLVNMMHMNGSYERSMEKSYGGFWTTLIAVILFVSLYRVQLGKKTAKIFAFVAGGVFEAYLISVLFDSHLYVLVPAWNNPKFYIFSWLCITLPIFVVTILVGKLLHFFVAKAGGLLTKAVYKLFKL